MDYFKNRHSFRNFASREVSKQLIDSIIEEASHAPNTGNMQTYSVIVSRSPEMLAKLRPLHFSQPAAVNAQVMLTVCADYYRFSRWCKASGAEPGYDNFLSFISAVIDATAFAQQIVTIAELKGLGTCYLGTVTYNAPEISELLHLPELVVPVACIALGWPEGEPQPAERLGVEAIAYDEVYPEFTDEEIMRLYKPKDDFPQNVEFVKENGKDSLAAIFTDIRYPRKMNEEVSEKLMALLREKGYIKD